MKLHGFAYCNAHAGFIAKKLISANEKQGKYKKEITGCSRRDP